DAVGKPTNVEVVATGTESATLSWDAPRPAEFSHYGVSLNPIEDGAIQFRGDVVIEDFSAPAATIEGLAPETEYFVVVHAEVTERMVVEAKAYTTVETAALTPPPAPTNLSVSNRGLTAVEITWDAPKTAESVDRYSIFEGGEKSHSAGDTEATVAGLQPDSSYTIGVAAVDSEDERSEQATIEVTTQAAPDGVGVRAFDVSGEPDATPPSARVSFSGSDPDPTLSISGAYMLPTPCQMLALDRLAVEDGTITVALTDVDVRYGCPMMTDPVAWDLELDLDERPESVVVEYPDQDWSTTWDGNPPGPDDHRDAGLRADRGRRPDRGGARARRGPRGPDWLYPRRDQFRSVGGDDHRRELSRRVRRHRNAIHCR
ncbi:MAG: fibronectin type III domain-containing protein, partial [Halococcoides sp.]